jgi:hypothetical protein
MKENCTELFERGEVWTSAGPITKTALLIVLLCVYYEKSASISLVSSISITFCFHCSDTYLGMVAYGYFLVYVFLIVVVLMNLLNGLAVSDTGDIKVSIKNYFCYIYFLTFLSIS